MKTRFFRFCDRYLTIRTIGAASLFVAILCSAAWFRVYTFWLPHWQGDQSQYVALAKKIESENYIDFNLSRLKIQRLVFKDYPDWRFMYPVILLNDDPGDFYAAYDRFGLQFNKMSLYHKSPLFPAVLSMSHRLFLGYNKPLGVIATKTYYKFQGIIFNPVFFNMQFWAAIVPFVCSLLTIVLTFFFARHLFGLRTAFMSMALLSLHPVSIINAYKVLSDDLATVCGLTAMYLFYLAAQRGRNFLVFTAGMIAGYAVLAKQSLLLVVPAVWAFQFFSEEALELKSPRTWARSLMNKNGILFFLGMLLISYNWFELVYKVYGNPFYQPEIKQTFITDRSGWFKTVLQTRPHSLWLFIFNVPLLCFPFIFGHLTIVDFAKKLVAGPRCGDSHRRPLLFLWFWIISFLVFFIFRVESREERYLLPAYPAMAILSGYGLERFRRWLATRTGFAAAGTVILVLFLLAALWSVPISFITAFNQRFLVLDPWASFKECWQFILKGP